MHITSLRTISPVLAGLVFIITIVPIRVSHGFYFTRSPAFPSGASSYVIA
ncbi:MAG TPA: hypothetical protein VH796_07655 [Nitrososphaeraceae archaeon]